MLNGLRDKFAIVGGAAPRAYWYVWWGTLVNRLGGFVIPLLTIPRGVLILHETPSAPAMVGILLVVAGLYFVGLRKGASALEPIRAFATSRASWIALLAALVWTVTSLTHKVGIAEVGAMPC